VRTRLNRCPDCGFVFQPEAPVDARRRDRDHGQREARLRLRWMGFRGARSGRLLEVGAGGVFQTEARRAGFEPVESVPEPDAGVVDWAEDAELASEAFDVVCLWHVLEHTREPRAMLNRLLACLQPGGLLFCEVPNVGGTMARALGDRWDHLDPAHNVSFFDPDSLLRAFAACGYEGIVTETIPMLRYAPLDASTLLRELPRRVSVALRHGMPVISRHRSKQDLLRACARRPRALFS
jgi:SAM-dependent methyltransferase